MCGSTSGDWLLSDELEGLSLQPGVQHAQASGGAHRVWVDLLWLFVVRGKLSALELWGAKWWGSCFWTVEGAAGPQVMGP